jgi:hypothetical protein
VLDENEISLLQFVAQEAAAVHPSILPLIERAKGETPQVAQRAFGRRA